MFNEMEEIFPVQFVEGLNENEKPATGRFLTWEESGIAFPYVPAITYSLCRIQIHGMPRNVQVNAEHSVRLYTDHKDRPSHNSIGSGKLIVPQGSSEQWLEVVMERHIVVISRRKYWLSFEEYPLSFSIGLAQEGQELGLRTGFAEKWASSSLGKHKCMLRFYGRVIHAAIPSVTEDEQYPSRSLRRIERCLVEIVKLMKDQKALLIREDHDDIQTNHRLQNHSQDETRR